MGDLSESKIWMAISGGFGALFVYVATWSNHISTLVSLMIIDFLFGILTPILVGKSKKCPSGKLSSQMCRRGLVKKCVAFLLIYVAYILSKEVGILALTDAVVMGFIVSETISIVENAAILGIPIPKVFLKLLKVMNEKASAGIDILASGEVSKINAADLTLESIKKDVHDASPDAKPAQNPSDDGNPPPSN